MLRLKALRRFQKLITISLKIMSDITAEFCREIFEFQPLEWLQYTYVFNRNLFVPCVKKLMPLCDKCNIIISRCNCNGERYWVCRCISLFCLPITQDEDLVQREDALIKLLEFPALEPSDRDKLRCYILNDDKLDLSEAICLRYHDIDIILRNLFRDEPVLRYTT